MRRNRSRQRPSSITEGWSAIAEVSAKPIDPSESPRPPPDPPGPQQSRRCSRRNTICSRRVTLRPAGRHSGSECRASCSPSPAAMDEETVSGQATASKQARPAPPCCLSRPSANGTRAVTAAATIRTRSAPAFRPAPSSLITPLLGIEGRPSSPTSACPAPLFLAVHVRQMVGQQLVSGPPHPTQEALKPSRLRRGQSERGELPLDFREASLQRREVVLHLRQFDDKRVLVLHGIS